IPVKINQTAGGVPAFVPSAAVMVGGMVGVSYYDLRKATPAQSGILTDAWLTLCRATCDDESNWTEIHISGPFDLQRAPFGRGFFLGDYEGVVGTANGFLLLHAVTEPAGTPELTGAYLVRVSLP